MTLSEKERLGTGENGSVNEKMRSLRVNTRTFYLRITHSLHLLSFALVHGDPHNMFK